MNDTRGNFGILYDVPSLGILGLGSRSTLFYIEKLNAGYNNTCGGDSSCPLLILNSNFNAINPHLPDRWDKLEPVLLKYLTTLARLSVSKILIPNITLHECYDRISADAGISSLDVIHPVFSTIEQLHNDSCRKVVLFGSCYTMQSVTLQQTLSQAGIEAVIPEPQDRLTIDDIRRKIYVNSETKSDITEFNTLLSRYGAIAPVIIACTELSLVLNDMDCPIYDMARIQINRALQKNFGS